MNRKYFKLVIWLQFTFLAVDMALNVLQDLYRHSPVKLLLLAIVQDFCIVSSLLVMCLTIFNTYSFQVGEFGEVICNFKTPVAVNLLYLTLSLALHVWTMKMTEEGEPSSRQCRLSAQNTAVDVALYTLQRFVGVLHYYFYKKTAFLMADDKLYRPSRKATPAFAMTADYQT